MTLTAERLRELLHYDPSTGHFTWLQCLSIRAPVGRRAGYNQDGYIAVGINGQPYMAHRLAWLYVYGVWPKGPLDHINGKRADNRIANLRECNMSQNIANSPRSKANTSGIKGVSYHSQTQKWRASIKRDGKPYHLGLFKTKEEAGKAYAEAAERLFGSFARTG